MIVQRIPLAGYMRLRVQAAQRALEAAERRRKLAANIAPETPGPGADAGGGKRTRPMKDITVNETPTCKTPNPKHIKNTECATTPAVDPKQQTPVVNTPNQQTPVVNTPNKKLFATPAKGGTSQYNMPGMQLGQCNYSGMWGPGA